MINFSKPIVATLGDDIVLPCRLEPAVDASGLTLERARPDLNPRFVHLRRSGVELQIKKHKSFQGRTSLFDHELQSGNLSLKLSRVTLSDRGTYKCFLPGLDTQSSVQLVVGQRNELQKTKKEHQDNNARMENTLQDLETGLKECRDQIKEQLDKQQTEKEENRKKLQAVEEEITEREQRMDKPERLIQQKESLLKAEWKSNETMRNYEELKMKMENLLEPIELEKRWSQVIGSQLVMAIVGEDVVLPCPLDAPVDPLSMTLEWGRPDLEPRFVHVWHNGQVLLDDQNEAYKGRTSLSINDLKSGDISLKLSTVKTSDTGRYRCYNPKLGKEYFVELLVAAVSWPAVSLAGLHRASAGAVLLCESGGWYPEPELLWLDAEGNLLSAGAPESVRGPDDLYALSGRATVEKRHGNSFTCRVHQKSGNRTRDAHITVPGSTDS
ncbi:butyrophilin-like protein 2 [Clinocottus analis]|uniref:butyrophilin-like protein 2 n=1 Tax=Clinocottus analis TaxID=304258 RepID=UPI0035BF61B6